MTSPARHRFGQGDADGGVGAGSRNGLSRLLVLLKALQPDVGTVDTYCHRKHVFGDSWGLNVWQEPMALLYHFKHCGFVKAAYWACSAGGDRRLLTRGQYN